MRRSSGHLGHVTGNIGPSVRGLPRGAIPCKGKSVTPLSSTCSIHSSFTKISIDTRLIRCTPSGYKQLCRSIIDIRAELLTGATSRSFILRSTFPPWPLDIYSEEMSLPNVYMPSMTLKTDKNCISSLFLGGCQL